MANFTTPCTCMNPHMNGTLDTDCNCVYLPYCDGASFAGYRARPWHVYFPRCTRPCYLPRIIY